MICKNPMCLSSWDEKICVARQGWQHVANVDGLKPGTRYFYRVANDRYLALANDRSSVSLSGVFSFRTLRTASQVAAEGKPLRVAVFGDLGDFNGQARPYIASRLKNDSGSSGGDVDYLDQLWHIGDF